MSETSSEPAFEARCSQLERDVARLTKINRALMSRVERSVDMQGSAFTLLQAATALEGKVRERTETLQQTLSQLERSNAELLISKNAADAANRAKSQFLASMSHEIRTPMNGVLGMLEALQSTMLDETQCDFLRTAYTSAEALLALINEILDYSKIEAGALAIERVDFDLRAAVRNCVQLWSKRATDKGLTLQLDIDPRCPDYIVGDSLRLGQVLGNLISNAIKFTEQGSVALRINVIESSDDCTLLFDVSDTGVGMSASVVERLFSAFMQADGSTSRRYGGTGLGLAICQQLVQLMGGRIDVCSTLGVGSCFQFSLTFARGHAHESVPATTLAPTSAIDLANIRVLVVDDNDTNRKVAGSILDRLGVAADFAADGSAAESAVRGGAYDLVFMDCHMPVFDGFEATAAIRRWEQEQRRVPIPIVAVSASAFREDRERCAAAGMSDFVPKPVNLAAIKAALERALGVVSFAETIDAPEVALPDLRTDLFDLAQLHEMRMMTGEGFGALRQQFAANVRTQLATLRAIAERRDAVALRLAAHKLKGSSATLGAKALSGQCHELEMLGAQGTIDDLEARLNALGKTAEEVLVELQRLTD